ncbi:Zn(2)-C6 fungal-type DNA-binding domain [Penicillium roqueforti FM164]|uniref:Zn(2)-C6 fungal-type DNA-binding domain n=1 Tax=Penicillium roqueforti (strain FM164) TaxID=1365484 RepID=W6QFZ1_PENRF|nr:Zn(2)-C6 fungal-type DNA-binding domain [Penicillium roqueforti FM164]
MPRRLEHNRNQTCRTRRVKCDGKRPKCTPCHRIARDCHWLQEGGTTAAPVVPVYQSSPLSAATPHETEYTSTEHPEYALQDPQVAKLFRHYITTLAAWYDLNDSKRHFKDVVPVRARYNPLLLSAILAFAAANQHRTLGEEAYLDIAEFYHYDSVRRLISLTKNIDSIPLGETLAAICLLRSYEIITQNVSSQSHLQGCYSLLASQRIHLTADLLSAGYWNYLREDITVALIEQRGLMITLSNQNAPAEPTEDADFASSITFLLGKIINRCLAVDSQALAPLEWEAMKSELDKWKASLPSYFDTIQTPGLGKQSSFPSIWTLRSWHTSTLHYYHTAMGILWLAQPAAQPLKALQRIDDMESIQRKLEYHATEICALALSSDSAPVWVNAFGPIAFYCPWLRDTQKRVEMAGELEKWGKLTGWPVSIIADALSPPSTTSMTL